NLGDVIAGVLRAESDRHLPHDVVQVALVREVDPAQLYIRHVGAATAFRTATGRGCIRRGHTLLRNVWRGRLWGALCRLLGGRRRQGALLHLFGCGWRWCRFNRWRWHRIRGWWPHHTSLPGTGGGGHERHFIHWRHRHSTPRAELGGVGRQRHERTVQ